MRKRIASQSDMREVEEEIIKQLGSEKRHCAFLRTKDYVSLRLAAVYPTLSGLEHKAPISVYFNGICVTLTCEDGAGVVGVRRFDQFVYHGERESENPPEGEPEAKRVKGL